MNRHLVNAMKSLYQIPEVFLSASAIGFYGNGRPVELYEDLPGGKGFLSNVCQEWEHETFKTKKIGVRTIALRIGLVLGYDGGAFFNPQQFLKVYINPSFIILSSTISVIVLP